MFVLLVYVECQSLIMVHICTSRLRSAIQEADGGMPSDMVVSTMRIRLDKSKQLLFK